jgi:hypothetical protein
VRFLEKRDGTRYAVVVFLHSGASRPRNVEALFFMLVWD